MRKLLLFDYDGVLVESLHFYYRKVKGALELMGLNIIRTEEDYLTLFEDNFYASLEKKGVDLAQFLTAIKQVESPTYSVRIHPFMVPVVRELTQKHTLIVISSNAREMILPLLTAAEISGCFQDIMGAETAFSKEEKIKIALSKYRVKKEDTFYIGDTAGDIKEGKGMGIKTVAITWGWHGKDRLLLQKPDFLIEDPKELLSLF